MAHWGWIGHLDITSLLINMDDKEFQERLAAVKMAARLDRECWATLRSKLLADLDQEWPYGKRNLAKAIVRLSSDGKRTPDKS